MKFIWKIETFVILIFYFRFFHNFTHIAQLYESNIKFLIFLRYSMLSFSFFMKSLILKYEFFNEISNIFQLENITTLDTSDMMMIFERE